MTGSEILILRVHFSSNKKQTRLWAKRKSKFEAPLAFTSGRLITQRANQKWQYSRLCDVCSCICPLVRIVCSEHTCHWRRYFSSKCIQYLTITYFLVWFLVYHPAHQKKGKENMELCYVKDLQGCYLLRCQSPHGGGEVILVASPVNEQALKPIRSIQILSPKILACNEGNREIVCSHKINKWNTQPRLATYLNIFILFPFLEIK